MQLVITASGMWGLADRCMVMKRSVLLIIHTFECQKVERLQTGLVYLNLLLMKG